MLLPLGDRAAIVASLRAALEAVLADPGQLAELSRRAVERAFGLFAWPAKARQTTEVYRWVLGQRADKPDRAHALRRPSMRFVVSLAEQGFGSILTFAINLWLIRNGAAESYGVYVFWLSVAWVLGTAQGTLVIAHLFALPSARDQAAARRDPERLFLSVTLGLLTWPRCGDRPATRRWRRPGPTLRGLARDAVHPGLPAVPVRAGVHLLAPAAGAGGDA